MARSHAANSRFWNSGDLASAVDGPWDHQASNSHGPNVAPGTLERSVGKDPTRGVKGTSTALGGGELGTRGAYWSYWGMA